MYRVVRWVRVFRCTQHSVNEINLLLSHQIVMYKMGLPCFFFLYICCLTLADCKLCLVHTHLTLFWTWNNDNFFFCVAFVCIYAFYRLVLDFLSDVHKTIFFLVYNKSNNDFFLLLADDGYVYMLVKCECVKDTASDKSKVIHKFECHKYTVFYDIQRLRYTNDWLDALEMCYIFCCVVFLLLGLVGRFGLSRFVRFTVSPVGVQVMKSISNH